MDINGVSQRTSVMQPSQELETLFYSKPDNSTKTDT